MEKSKLEFLRGKRDHGTLSGGESTELRLLEREEERRISTDTYKTQYFELRRKYDCEKKENAELQEQLQMKDATIQVLLAALQGKIGA